MNFSLSSKSFISCTYKITVLSNNDQAIPELFECSRKISTNTYQIDVDFIYFPKNESFSFLSLDLCHCNHVVFGRPNHEFS